MIILDGMVGPNININFGPPRRRRRRRAVGGAGALIALIVAAILGYSKLGRPGAPPPAAAARLPAAAAALDQLRAGDLEKGLQQIPATIIDKGPLRHVPYLSYSSGDVEINVYGDPDAPACLEIGTFSRDSFRRSACRDSMVLLLPDVEDRIALNTLTGGKQTRAGLTFEITPETAPDAYGRWWVSVYDTRLLDASRASETELKGMAGPRPAGDEAVRARPGSTVYVKGYYRKDGTYVPGYAKKTR